MLQKHTTSASLVFVAVFFLGDCIQGQRVARLDAQVKILSSPERTAFGTAKALRTRMRHMGKKRAVFGGDLDFTTPYFLHPNGDITGGCRKVRVSRFIGNKDRNCTSIKPVRYSVCGGFCLPKFRLTQLLFGSDYSKILAKAKHRWRCVGDSFRYKKVRVICPDDGSVVRYRIRIVNSCVCKEFKRQHNEPAVQADRRTNQKRKRNNG